MAHEMKSKNINVFKMCIVIYENGHLKLLKREADLFDEIKYCISRSACR